MAAVTPIVVNEAGNINATLTTPSASDTFTWSPNLLLVVTNGNASTCTVTVQEQVSTDPIVDSRYGNFTKADASIAIATGNTGVIGGFKAAGFMDSNGDITVTFSVTSSVTVLPLYL